MVIRVDSKPSGPPYVGFAVILAATSVCCRDFATGLVASLWGQAERQAAFLDLNQFNEPDERMTATLVQANARLVPPEPSTAHFCLIYPNSGI